MSKYLTAIFIFLVSSAAYAQNGEPARESSCRTCHGVGGAAPIVPNYPKINGQNKAYLVSALKAYRAGERKGGLAVVMAAQASQLSDEDIEELASYYASQK